MKMKNRILSDLILASIAVLYTAPAGAAPKSGDEPLRKSESTSVVPVAHKAPEFLHRMPLHRNSSTDPAGIQRLYGKEYGPAEETGTYRAYEWVSSSNAWNKTLPATAVSGFSFLPKPDPAPRLFANAAGNERYFWLKPPPVIKGSKAPKKKPVQLFSLKPVRAGEGSMEEQIRSGAYHYDIVPKSAWHDWIKPKEISDQWDGFLIYGTEAAPVTLISFNF